MVAVACMTRSLADVELGVSSRGIMHWASASKANARLNGRNYVSIEDVQEIAPYVLTHRLIMQATRSRRCAECGVRAGSGAPADAYRDLGLPPSERNPHRAIASSSARRPRTSAR